MSRCVIVGSAAIRDYENVNRNLRGDDFLIYCDGGLKHRNNIDIPGADRPGTPDLIVGDFDSFDKNSLEGPGLENTEVITLPVKKDDTDVFYAVKEAVKRGFGDFLLVGTVGERLDHTLCNLSVLQYLYERGKIAKALDDYGEMEIVGKDTVYIEDSWRYFSLLNICGTAKGISIRNAVYPLEDGEIGTDYQYGVSNEVVPGERAEVSVREGSLLLVKVHSA